MSGSADLVELHVEHGWHADPDLLLTQVRQVFDYGQGDDRATGQLYAAGEQGWVPPLAMLGPELLDNLAAQTGIRYTIVAFQAYRDGAGCDWHTDDPFDAQAVLSLGVTRTFGIRRSGGDPQWFRIAAADLVVMPSGFQQQWQHCVPTEPVAGERISIVFRTPRR